MDLRTALRVLRVLGALESCLLALSILTKIIYFLYGAIIVLLAYTVVFFVYTKCPHCGRRLITLNDRYIQEKRCPYCGKDLDI